MRILFFVLIFYSCSNNTRVRFNEQKKGSNILSGTFINDTIPHGVIKTVDSFGFIISKENFQYGVLDGEAIYYYNRSRVIKVKTSFVKGVQSGIKYTYDSLGKLLSKSNYYFGKEIGSDFLYDSLGNVDEYSFKNFENEMLYYCSLGKEASKYNYPSDAYLIRATTEPVLINNVDKLYIFFYLISPPKLKLDYRICTSNENDSLITLKHVQSDNFYYEYYLTLRNSKQKVAIVVDKYDSLLQKKSVIVKYLKTSYP